MGLVGYPSRLQQIANIKLKILLNLFSYFYCVFYFREINSSSSKNIFFFFFFYNIYNQFLTFFFFCQNFQQKLWTKINIFGENTGFKMFVIFFFFFLKQNKGFKGFEQI